MEGPWMPTPRAYMKGAPNRRRPMKKTLLKLAMALVLKRLAKRR